MDFFFVSNYLQIVYDVNHTLTSQQYVLLTSSIRILLTTTSNLKFEFLAPKKNTKKANCQINIPRCLDLLGVFFHRNLKKNYDTNCSICRYVYHLILADCQYHRNCMINDHIVHNLKLKFTQRSLIVLYKYNLKSKGKYYLLNRFTSFQNFYRKERLTHFVNSRTSRSTLVQYSVLTSIHLYTFAQMVKIIYKPLNYLHIMESNGPSLYNEVHARHILL